MPWWAPLALVCWCWCVPSGVTPRPRPTSCWPKLLKLRIFSDDAGKMNRSVQDLDGQGACGGLLLVSQFTLAADTTGGKLPQLYPGGGARARAAAVTTTWWPRPARLHPEVATGQFAADMQVHLVNDGPVTIPMRMAPAVVA